MFICNKEKQQAYIEQMEQFKEINRRLRQKRQELILNNWNEYSRKKSFLNTLRNHLSHIKSNSYSSNIIDAYNQYACEELPKSNYFSEKKIAVYTCILGNYDLLTNLRVKPDNIDYFVIADHPSTNNPDWNLLNASSLNKNLSHLSLIEQNRWYKMHPHLLFPDYEYSVYLDGNITPVTDLTELINRIGPHGIATHHHYSRKCVYDEFQAVLKMKKDNPESIRKHQSFLYAQEMPKNYGLADCSVIARQHHSFCIHLMEQWWKEFLAHSRRDQLSFPYVLFKNNIPMQEITTLGLNRIFNNALDIVPHSHEQRKEPCTI